MSESRGRILSAKVTALLGFLAAFSAMAMASDLQTGRVFADGNGNGRLDAGEAGIAGVVVSNGSEIVRSDAEGRYSLRIAPGQTAFLIKPAGWRVAQGDNGLPRFWRHHQPVAGPALKHGGIAATGSLPSSVDFALHREPAGEVGLDVLLFADPQGRIAGRSRLLPARHR